MSDPLRAEDGNGENFLHGETESSDSSSSLNQSSMNDGYNNNDGSTSADANTNGNDGAHRSISGDGNPQVFQEKEEEEDDEDGYEEGSIVLRSESLESNESETVAAQSSEGAKNSTAVRLNPQERARRRKEREERVRKRKEFAHIVQATRQSSSPQNTTSDAESPRDSFSISAASQSPRPASQGCEKHLHALRMRTIRQDRAAWQRLISGGDMDESQSAAQRRGGMHANDERVLNTAAMHSLEEILNSLKRNDGDHDDRELLMKAISWKTSVAIRRPSDEISLDSPSHAQGSTSHEEGETVCSENHVEDNPQDESISNNNNNSAINKIIIRDSASNSGALLEDSTELLSIEYMGTPVLDEFALSDKAASVAATTAAISPVRRKVVLRDPSSPNCLRSLIETALDPNVSEDIQICTALAAARVFPYAPEELIESLFSLIPEMLKVERPTPIVIAGLRMVMAVVEIESVFLKRVYTIIDCLDDRLDLARNWSISPIQATREVRSAPNGVLSEHVRILGLTIEVIAEEIISSENITMIEALSPMLAHAVATLSPPITPVAVVALARIASSHPRVVAEDSPLLLESFLRGCSQLLDLLVFIVRYNPAPFSVAVDRLVDLVKTVRANSKMESGVLLVMAGCAAIRPLGPQVIQLLDAALLSADDGVVEAAMEALYELGRHHDDVVPLEVLQRVAERTLSSSQNYVVAHYGPRILGCSGVRSKDMLSVEQIMHILAGLLRAGKDAYVSSSKKRDATSEEVSWQPVFVQSCLAAMRHVASRDVSMLADFEVDIQGCLSLGDPEAAASAKKVMDLLGGRVHAASEWCRTSASPANRPSAADKSWHSSRSCPFSVEAADSEFGFELQQSSKMFSGVALRTTRKIARKEGQLWKKGEGVFSFWEHRWFVCENFVLKWFLITRGSHGEPRAGKLRKELDVRSIVEVHPLSLDSKEEKAHQFCLVLSSGRKRMLAAKTKEQRDEWVQYLTRAISVVKEE